MPQNPVLFRTQFEALRVSFPLSMSQGLVIGSNGLDTECLAPHSIEKGTGGTMWSNEYREEAVSHRALCSWPASVPMWLRVFESSTDRIVSVSRTYVVHDGPS